jgi:ribosomal 50S subunit-recycling heat shock protein
MTKRRSIAQDMLKNGVVKINDIVVKPSKNVAVGDRITLVFLDGEKSYKVLQLPATKSTPKSQQDQFIEEIA